MSVRLMVMAAACLGSACARSAPAPAVPAARGPALFPTGDWERLTDPVAAGWSASGLDTVRATVSRMNTTAMVVVEAPQRVLPALPCLLLRHRNQRRAMMRSSSHSLYRLASIINMPR